MNTALHEHIAADDCWNRIGILGDASCPRLREHVHCRNCTVYSAAAMTLLETDLPQDYRTRWTAHVARPEQNGAAGLESAIVFRLRGEWLALPSRVLEEVAGMRPIHTLPHRRGGIVLGLANVRGELRACVSLARLLGLQDAASDTSDKQRLLVARQRRDPVAFPVDAVHGLHRFQPQQLQAQPATIALAAASYTRAVLRWQETFVALLDEHALFRTVDRSLASASAI